MGERRVTDVSGVRPCPYLTPPEIKLWELARNAADDFRPSRHYYAYRDAAPPSTISSLLETLEKTRRALDELAMDAERFLSDGPHPDDTPPDFPERVHRTMVLYDNLTATASNARTLLSGFSGDAPSEERGG